MEKVFTDIPGLEGYMANEIGEIKGKYGILTQRKNGNYLNVQVYTNNKNTGIMVHELIAKTFWENPKDHKFVRHINGNLHDNQSKNLEWCEFLYEKKKGEKFKPIKEWEKYKISNYGNIVSMTYGVLLELQKQHNYYTVSLKDQSNDKTVNKLFFVHELVVNHFVKNNNPTTNKIIKHKDGDLLNNNYKNLEWVEQLYVPLEGEKFVDIIGYETSYKISNFGNVLIKSTGELMKFSICGEYHSVGLSNDNDRKKILVHKLVAQHFIENKDKTKTVVDHIDSNKLNNCFNNLRWCTQSENMKFHAESGNRTYSYKKVIQKDENDKIIKVWDSLDDVVKSSENYVKSTLYGVLMQSFDKKTRLTYGYKWQYEKQEVNLEKDEVFKNIGTFEGNNYDQYECSNYGKVRRIDNDFLSLNLVGGYNVAALTHTTNKVLSLRVHRLVAYLFVPNPNPEKFDIVNHLDKNRTNNHYKNLEWTDISGNTRHAIGKAVQQIDIKTGSVLKTFDTITDAYKHLGKDLVGPHISRCCTGKAMSAFGFKWSYV